MSLEEKKLLILQQEVQELLKDDTAWIKLEMNFNRIIKMLLLIGSGIPLFGDLDMDIQFTHLRTDVYSNGLVKSHYKRQRE